MSLTFNRPGMRSGHVIIREPAEEGAPAVTYSLGVRDIGTQVTVLDEGYVLGKYPMMFEESTQWQAWKAARDAAPALVSREAEAEKGDAVA